MPSAESAIAHHIPEKNEIFHKLSPTQQASYMEIYNFVWLQYGSRGVTLTQENAQPHLWVLWDKVTSRHNPGRLSEELVQSAILSAQPLPVEQPEPAVTA